MTRWLFDLPSRAGPPSPDEETRRMPCRTAGLSWGSRQAINVDGANITSDHSSMQRSGHEH